MELKVHIWQGMSIAVRLIKSRMDTQFAELSAVTLRSMIVDETQKFILSLQFSSPLSDLEAIREKIKLLSDALEMKEKKK